METTKEIIKIKNLEKEIEVFEEQLKLKNNIIEGLINILPFPLVVYNNDGDIIIYNNIFLNIISFKSKNELVDGVDNNIKTILTNDFYSKLEQEFYGNSGILLNKVTLKGSEYLPSYYSICNNSINVLIFRDLMDKTVIKEEILSLLENVVNSNHLMVKQIGSILGEESTKRTKTLNSIINSIK